MSEPGFFDDLLKYEDDEPGAHRQAAGRSGYRWLLRPALLSLAGAVGVGVVARVAGFAVPYPLIFMVLLVVQLLHRALAWIAPGPVPGSLRQALHPPVDAEPAQDGLTMATGRWDTRLSWARLQSDPAHFSRTVQPRMVQLIDERLRLGHGVVRASDPARARALLSDPLWTFVTTPVRTTITPRDLAALISQMEEL
jgi:hypothetical protein